MRYFKFVFTLALGTATMLPARAVPLIDFELQSAAFSQAPTHLTLGYRFQVFNSISVDGIGFFDEGGDGLDSVHNLGLWNIDDSANPVATGAVNPGPTAATSEASASNLGTYIYDDFSSPLALAPGTYVIGASYGPSNRDVVVDKPTGLLANAGPGDVMFLGGAFGFERSPAQVVFPEFMVGDGWFGPSLRIYAATPASLGVAQPLTVPEPLTLALLLSAIAVAGLGRRRLTDRLPLRKS